MLATVASRLLLASFREKYAIVASRPLSMPTFGSHPSELTAFPITGLRRWGSSFGKGR
jgi:hypothetical protein